MSWTLTLALAHYAAQLLTLLRALTRPDRESASRLAWVLVILALPGVGIAAYLLLGEVNPGRRTLARLRTMEGLLPRAPEGGAPPAVIAPALRAPFGRAAAVNGFAPAGGNQGTLLDSSEAAIGALIADIDAAQESVHILVYIWLDDTSGRRLAEAVARAALRGVACRCMVDALGSRRFLKSESWQRMRAAGALTGVAFSTRFALLRLALGRIDIRNHRKIMVIDGRVAYCGSQNCADAAFAIKAKYAPWVDIMLRLEGPAAWQSQQLFVSDWTLHTGEDIAAVLDRPAPVRPGGFPALVFGTGPGLSAGAVPDVFGLALAAARERVVISTPYFVPTMALHDQLRATALRGVAVTLILPARNDSHFVAWASRAFYASLLRAGVEIREYAPGLLHAKTFTVDRSLALVGSANFDRRSFELNFENNLLLADPALCGDIRARQATYLAQSRTVPPDEAEGWSLGRRLLYNVAAMVSPVL